MQLSKSTYHPGERVIAVGLAPNSRVEIMKMDQPIAELFADKEGTVVFQPQESLLGSFTVISGTDFASADVLRSWIERPRYGFICNFDENSHSADVLCEELTKFSSNAVQLYDWHYRHEKLVSPNETFIDPLGRELSHKILIELVSDLKTRGIAPMGYVAAYATSNEGASDHPEWLLFDSAGEPLDFHGFLKITDISRGAPFRSHILNEAINAISLIGFTGIHFDQYGEPKEGFRVDGTATDVGLALSELVTEFKETNPNVPSTLNAVKNWPREELAASKQDFYYMELWEETNGRFIDVAEEILESRKLSENKGVVVAIYIPEAKRGSNIIVDSIIQAAGAWRIEFGEKDGFLSDPYFPKFETPGQQFLEEARIRNNFAVALGDILRGKIPKLDFRFSKSGNCALFDYSTNDEKIFAIVNLGKHTMNARWETDLETPPFSLDLDISDLFSACTSESFKWFSPKNPCGISIGVQELGNFKLESWGLLKGKVEQIG